MRALATRQGPVGHAGHPIPDRRLWKELGPAFKGSFLPHGSELRSEHVVRESLT